MPNGTVQELIASLSTLTDEELEALRTAVGAELMERDLSENGTEKLAEGRASLGGESSPAPAGKTKIRASQPQVKDAWDWVTVKVACGECRGRGERKTLWDGVPYTCKSCQGRGWLELTVPVLRCPECGGPPDERVHAGMKCAGCAYGR